MINKVILIGRVGKDPVIRGADGNKFGDFSLATSERFKDVSGELQERTEWHTVKCNGKNAEFCDQYVHKGDMMYVEGRIHYDSFINKDGIEVRTTEIRASIVKKLYSVNDDKSEDRQRPRASQAIRVGGGKQTQDDLPY